MTNKKINKAVIILSVFALAGIILYRIFFAPKFVFSEYSPDKQYRIDVYRPFTICFFDGTDCNRYFVVLKDKRGRTIRKSCNKCLVNALEIQWDVSPNAVYFGRAQAINLKTGKCCD